MIKQELIQNIQQLSTSVAPSGAEINVQRLWSDLISKYVDEIRTYKLCNTIGAKYGQPSKKIVITAHADEVGIIITRIDPEQKRAYFEEIGGIDTTLLPGRVIKFQKSDVVDAYGVIGCQPIHCQSRCPNSNNRPIEVSDLYIDFGDSLSNIAVGDYGTICSTFIQNGNILSGKAMDNRVGMAILVAIAKEIKDIPLNGNVYFVSSTMEEIGARGIRTIANEISPDECIVVDMSIATDTPYTRKENMSTVSLGSGVSIAIGPNLDSTIENTFISLAKTNGIPIQLEVCNRPTGTDANPLQIMKNGIPCGLIGIPCRYMHSPVETVHIEDIENAVQLIKHYIIHQLT